MFTHQLKSTRITKTEDGKIVEDYILVKVYTPNGNHWLYDFKVSVQDIKNIINLLSNCSLTS